MTDETTTDLPENLRSLFWDCDFSSLSWRQYSNFIIKRILERGTWDEITWLRRSAGDEAIRDWFLRKQGGGLDPMRLRFWQVILDLPEDLADEWVREAKQSIWHGRHER